VQPKWDLTRDSGVDDAAIWRKHKEELIRYATVLVGADHSEDVLSTVVERVLRRHGSLSHLDDARPYLFRAVLNESRGRIRRRRAIPWERGPCTCCALPAARDIRSLPLQSMPSVRVSEHSCVRRRRFWLRGETVRYGLWFSDQPEDRHFTVCLFQVTAIPGG